MTLLARFAVLALLFAAPFAALPQWPTQPVRVMVGFPPGGTTDVIGRLVANELRSYWLIEIGPT